MAIRQSKLRRFAFPRVVRRHLRGRRNPHLAAVDIRRTQQGNVEWCRHPQQWRYGTSAFVQASGDHTLQLISGQWLQRPMEICLPPPDLRRESTCMTPDGKATPIFEPQELQVQALVVDKNGVLLCRHQSGRQGLSHRTQSRRRKVRGKGNTTDAGWSSSVYFEPGTKYIWDLALDRLGNLFHRHR